MKRLKVFTILIFLGAFFGKSSSSGAISPEGLGSNPVYLPIISTPPGPPIPKVNVPFISGDIQPAVTNQTAIFWFGRVYETENYTDVRVAYTEEFLYVRLAVFDRQLWYDMTPSIQDLTDWDSAALYLNLNGNVGDSIGSNSYAFLGQLAWNEPNMEAAYQGSNGQWQQASIPFGSYAGWKSDGSGINDDSKPDRGWTLTYNIPYSSLGLGGMPTQGTVWGLAVVLYDRDDGNGAVQIPEKTWPPAMTPSTPSSWAELSFGLPSFTALPTQLDGTTTIRHGDSNGNVVKDGMVGGGSVCGAGLYSYGEWGEKNYAGAHQVNIQNQHDIADWPCFSKFFITFPLNKVPAGVQITSATLTMMHFSNAGNVGGTTNPVDSLLQVLTVAGDWNESTLTWNNAPLALENISRTLVPSYYGYPPPIARYFDVSSAAVEAFAAGEPLRLAVYSADADYHSGKYFFSSDAGYSNRPMLTVNWANP